MGQPLCDSENCRSVIAYGRVRGPIFVAMLGLASMLAPGCKGGGIPIHDLLANSGNYEGKPVQVVGEVKSAAGAFGYAVYQIEDDTGSITVVTERGGAPVTGATIGVKGTFHSAFSIGTDTVAVIKESGRRTF